MTIRISTHSRRQAMDWSLALISQGIQSTIEDTSESGWGLVVDESDHPRALETIRKYQAENRRWPWRRPIQENVLFDWGSLAWVGMIAAFYWLQTAHPQLRDAGIMDGMAVSQGEWWRLITAVFLHADLGHLATNASIGFVLLGLAMGRYGTGAGLLAGLLAGIGGNASTWFTFKSHLSLGASGMVLGCVGLLAAQAFEPRLSAKDPGSANLGTAPLESRKRVQWKYVLSGLAGGLMLFALLGLSPDSDVVAHFGGFVSGTVLGIVLSRLPTRRFPGFFNLLAGSAFVLIAALAWWRALQ